MVIAMYKGNGDCRYSSSLSTLVGEAGIGERCWNLYSQILKTVKEYAVNNDQVKDFKIRRI